jgi:hypothetical protein
VPTIDRVVSGVARHISTVNGREQSRWAIPASNGTTHGLARPGALIRTERPRPSIRINSRSEPARAPNGERWLVRRLAPIEYVAEVRRADTNRLPSPFAYREYMFDRVVPIEAMLRFRYRP